MDPKHATLSETTSLRVWPPAHPATSWQDGTKADLRDNRNPLLSSQDFRKYHDKVVRKEMEGMDPLWRKDMEDAFFDVHFFFPQKSQAEDEERSPWSDPEEQTEALQESPVLTALAERRLPEVQPNYDYFAHLLGADSEVFLRPKTCHIYLSTDEDFEVAATADGTCLYDDAYAPGGTLLGCQDNFSQPGENSNTGTGHDVHRSVSVRDQPRTYVRHTYSWSLTQSESRSVGDIASKWRHRFPVLRDKLLSALGETHPPHERPARCVMGPCDIIHMEVVLDLPKSSQFPTGTHLDARVEFSIDRPELGDHLWCSSTSVAKPWELRLDASEPPVWDRTSACCPLRRGGAPDVIVIDFPASSWGSTLYRLAKYAEAEREEGRETTEGRGEKGSGSPAPCDMLQQVAMYQEIWSAPSEGSGKKTWTRRAVLLWTFLLPEPRAKAATPETLDSMSQYHLQRAYLPAAVVPYDDTRVPDQGGQYPPGSLMADGNFGSFHHGGNVALSDQLQEQHAYLPNGNTTDDGCLSGLSAPQVAAYPPFTIPRASTALPLKA
ncbi:conidiophore development regulator abaA [Apiospora aurea]|uniref:Conidiophore development regulator abaA n=1 Tax=Apiospora aurea TaxID=335848 RepID=A0ABR1PT32_9PEZI